MRNHLSRHCVVVHHGNLTWSYDQVNRTQKGFPSPPPIGGMNPGPLLPPNMSTKSSSVEPVIRSSVVRVDPF